MEQNIQPKTGPKDFFLYIGITGTLYVTVVSLLRLLFEIIDRVFPDQLFFSVYTGGIRVAIASLIIIFPIYLVLSFIARREIIRDSAKRNLWVRRWLSYLTIFLAGTAVVVDLIVLLNNFLGGEITTRFTLKVLAVLIVAAAAFGYYLYDIRKNIPQRHCKLMMWLAVVLVLAAIVGGFLVIGSPVDQRDLKFDETRVSDLRNIQSEVVLYWENKDMLPQKLIDLENDIRGFRVPSDPETSDHYSYAVLGNLSFELCATFSLPSGYGSDTTLRTAIGGPYDQFGVLSTWDHGVGNVCFERTIDPDFFPKPAR